MALIDSEGFGLSLVYGNYLTYGLLVTSGGSAAGEPTLHAGGMYGDNYMSLWNNSKNQWRTAPSELDTFFFGARSRLNGANLTRDDGYVFADVSFTEQFRVTFTPDGTIHVKRGTTVLGVSDPLQMPPNGWQWVEVGGVIHASAGTVTVRINNVEKLVLTGIDTRGTAGATMRRYGVLAPGVGLGATHDTQHWVLCDDTGSAPWNTFLGDVRVQNLFPTANDAVQFTPTGLATNWQNAAKVPPVPFTDYNASSVVGEQDTFVMQPVSSDIGIVYGVHNKPLVYKNDPGARSGAAVLKSDATTAVGVTTVLSETAAQLKTMYQVDPHTAVQWTPVDVNLIKAGYQVAA